ncbi:MAG: SusC/RagA family TonB-linked outer membrane protein [Bacteroidota bacterium]
MNRLTLYLFLMLLFQQSAMAQIKVTGRVVSQPLEKPLPGASVKQSGSDAGTVTDSSGRFSLILHGSGRQLTVSYVGYKSQTLNLLRIDQEVSITLIPADNLLTEVLVSTGYQDIPQERAVGSFVQLDNEVLNRRVGPDIISRLEGAASGLNFTRRFATTPDTEPSLSIRGLSTFYANAEPLIVVDNFPYEGNIKNINPNDVESVTILKDASAASIWGARAGNGVIVITTKKGRSNQPVKVQFNSVYTRAERPDLFYNPGFLSSADHIALERQLFARNFYAGDENNLSKVIVSPVVELLIAQRDGKLTSAQVNSEIALLEKQDIRSDAEQYLYRQGANRQTSLNLSGGTSAINYFLSAGYDNNDQQSRGNGYSRLTLNSQNVYKAVKGLEISAGVNYIQTNSSLNSIGLTELSPASGKTIYPYARLTSPDGTPAVVQRTYRSNYAASAKSLGLLNWQYKPLEELDLNDNTRANNEIRINGGLKYKFVDFLSAELKYQYQRLGENSRNNQDPESFVVRDLLNRYTQTNGFNPIPYGGILNLSSSTTASHSGRGQLNFNHNWKQHRVYAIAGAELREIDNFKNASRLYGYDSEVLNSQLMIDYVTRFPTLPRNTATIPTGTTPLTDQLDRYVSYYGNASYEFVNRYTISGSLRQDASNLFGVETNQKRVPLWSAGLGWDISAEPFFKSGWFSYVKLRGTYGYNGNTDKTVTALTTARYSTDPLTGLPVATILSPGNPDLRWEKVGIANLGLDFATKNKRISGSLEMYKKYGQDLLGDLPLDPTTGYLGRHRINFAALQTTGADIQLHSSNTTGRVKWESDILFSYVRDKVTGFDNSGMAVSSYFTGFSIPVVGKSLYRIYAYPDAALDPANGDPLVTTNGVLGKDYVNYVRNITSDGLIDKGPQLPPYFGSLRNSISFIGLELSANITWKAGYYFRRNSISYDALFNSWTGHRDYTKRWQKPGDELITLVPSVPLLSNTSRDQVYLFSSSLVEKGDHLRLQDVNLSYTPTFKLLGSYAGKLRCYVYASNLGILWRANKQGLDPDYPTVQYIQPKTWSFGLSADL